MKLTHPLLISILTISSALPAATVADLTFTLNGDSTEYSVSDCNQNASDSLVIPNTYNGLPVTSIGSSAFAACRSITSVTIPDSVTSIGNSAFEDCNDLTHVTIPDSVTSIGFKAFRACTSLISMTIPDSVTSIGDRAVSYTHLTLPTILLV